LLPRSQDEYSDYAHTRKYTPLPGPIPLENLLLNITHLMLLGKVLPPDNRLKVSALKTLETLAQIAFSAPTKYPIQIRDELLSIKF
jgi:hypothetical protein